MGTCTRQHDAPQLLHHLNGFQFDSSPRRSTAQEAALPSARSARSCLPSQSPPADTLPTPDTAQQACRAAAAKPPCHPHVPRTQSHPTTATSPPTSPPKQRSPPCKQAPPAARAFVPTPAPFNLAAHTRQTASMRSVLHAASHAPCYGHSVSDPHTADCVAYAWAIARDLERDHLHGVVHGAVSMDNVSVSLTRHDEDDAWDVARGSDSQHPPVRLASPSAVHPQLCGDSSSSGSACGCNSNTSSRSSCSSTYGGSTSTCDSSNCSTSGTTTTSSTTSTSTSTSTGHRVRCHDDCDGCDLKAWQNCPTYQSKPVEMIPASAGSSSSSSQAEDVFDLAGVLVGLGVCRFTDCKEAHALRKVMQQCRAQIPGQRPGVSEVVHALHALLDNERRCYEFVTGRRVPSWWPVHMGSDTPH